MAKEVYDCIEDLRWNSLDDEGILMPLLDTAYELLLSEHAPGYHRFPSALVKLFVGRLLASSAGAWLQMFLRLCKEIETREHVESVEMVLIWLKVEVVEKLLIAKLDGRL
jgi:hypothetical protein